MFLNSITKGDNPEELIRRIEEIRKRIQRHTKEGKEDEVLEENDLLKRFNERYLNSTAGVWLDLNASFVKIRNQFEAGQFVVA